MTTRAGITLAALLALSVAWPRLAEGKRGKAKPVQAAVVVVDLHRASARQVDRARLVARLLARGLAPKARVGFVYMQGTDVVDSLPRRRFGRLDKLIATLYASYAAMDLSTALSRARYHLRLVDSNQARVFVISGALPEPTPQVRRLARAGVGISYFILGPGRVSATSGSKMARYHWLYNRSVRRSVRAELLRLGALGTGWRYATIGAWWKLAKPCPSGARVRKTRHAGMQAIACVRPDGTRHGRRSVWSARGLEYLDATYVDGKLHGRRRVWTSLGLLESEQQYRRGVRHGVCRLWYADGHKREYGRYRSGARDGVWRRWYRNGTLASRQHYRNGVPVGTWETWWRHGKRKTRMSYRRGKPHGSYERWTTGGTRVEWGEYRNGLRHGGWVLRSAGGVLRRIARYRNNRRHGTCEYYLDSGKLRRKEIYADGVIKETRWY